MPKKQVHNAFYFYMLDFKEEQKKQGIHYANMADVAEAAGPPWRLVPPSVRARFEAIAKAEKSKQNVPEQKYTSTGISFAEIQRAEQERQAAEEAERQDIQDFVTQKSVDLQILDEDMFVMDVNCYCKAGSSYLVGEMALLRFSLREGIRDTYHELINPGPAPVGYAYDAKSGAEDYGLPPLGEGEPSRPAQLLAHVVDYLRQRHLHGQLPPIYTLPEKANMVADFIQQLCLRAGEDESLFRVYRLDTLFFWLVKAVASGSGDAFPRDSLAIVALRRDKFKYTPQLACEYHEIRERATECALSRVKRWAYTVLDAACARASLPARPGCHLPPDYDLDSILLFREAHAPPAEAAGAPAAAGGSGACAWGRGSGSALGASASASAADSSLDTSHAASSASQADTSAASNTTAGSSLLDSSRKEKRVHVPLRKPKVDYSAQLRAPPPDLDARADFPDFPTPVGKGRGRGAGPPSGSFGKMNLN